MATLKIDHRLIAGIRTNLPSARVRADLKPITDRVINPVLSGTISVPDDVKAEIESLQAQLLRIVPTLPKGVAVNPIDIDALVTPVPAPLPQPLPSPSPAAPDPDAGRMSVYTQQSTMSLIQSAAAAASAAAPATPAPAPSPALQLADAQAEVERLGNQLVRLEQESADKIQTIRAELEKEQERAHRLETSLGGQREKVREAEEQRNQAKARVAALEKELATLRAAQQSAASLQQDLLKAQAELNNLRPGYQALEIERHELQTKLTKAEEEVVRLGSELAAKNKSAIDADKLITELEVARAGVEKLNIDLAAKNDELVTANNRAAELEAQLTIARGEINELIEVNARQSAIIVKLTEANGAKETTIAELQKQITALSEQLTKQGQSLTTAPVLNGSPLEMIQQAIALALGTLACQAEEINKSISEINANIAAKESDVADLDLQITARMAQIHQANERFQSRIDNLESEFAAAADSDEGVKIARQTIAKLTAELEAAIDPAKRDKINAKLLAAKKFLAQLETGLRRELRLGGREQIAAEKERDLARRRRELDTLVARKTKTSVELDRSLAAREQARLGITPLVGQLNEIRGILGSGERRVSGLLDSLPIAVERESLPEDNNS